MSILRLIIIVFVCIFLPNYMKHKKIVSKENEKKDLQDKRYATVNSHYSKETIGGNSVNNVQKQIIHNNMDNKELLKNTISTICSTKPNTEPASKVLKDNTKNDWLAKQLMEEKRAYRNVKHMFDNDIASEHSRVCDADGIDNGLED